VVHLRRPIKPVESSGYFLTLRTRTALPSQMAFRPRGGSMMVAGGPNSDITILLADDRRVSTTLRHSEVEFSEYSRLSFVVC
jgi:hypothetical protein